MAFPVVEARNATADTSDGTSFALALPAGIVAGDLLVACVAKDDDDAFTSFPPSGWNLVINQNQGTTMRACAVWRIADGSEGATVTFNGDSEQYVGRTWRISGHDPAVPPEAAQANASSTNANPPSLSPSWGAADTLWLAFAGWDANPTVTAAAPANYDNFINTPATGVEMAAAERTNNTATENPGSFTSTSEQWVAFTIAVKPLTIETNGTVTVHSSGSFNNSGAAGTTQSQSVTLAASTGGADRRLVVQVGSEHTTGDGASVSSITYGGVALQVVQEKQYSSGADVFLGIYHLRESDMPSNGSNTLQVNFSTSAEYSVDWVIYEGIDDDVEPIIGTPQGSDGATTLTEPLVLIEEDSMVTAVGYKNNTGGFSALTIAGGAATQSSSVDLAGGGANVTSAHRLLTTENGSQDVVFTQGSSQRQTLIAAAFSPVAPAVPLTIEYVNHAVGTGGDVTVAAGSDRVLVVTVIRSAATGAGTTATYGGVAMSIASNTNDWVQIFYMLNPPVGTATLAIGGTSIADAVAVQYNGVGSFVSAQEDQDDSFSFSPAGEALMVFGQASASTSHTPLSGVEERLDAGGDYYGDYIVGTSGTYEIGVVAATDPDSAAALFGVAVEGQLTATAAFGAGDATMGATSARVREAGAAAFVSGAAALAAAALMVHPATAAFAATAASSSGTATRVREGSAAFVSGDAAASATAARVRTALVAFEAAAAALATSAARARQASASFQAAPAAAASSAVLAHPALAAFVAGGAELEASAARVRGAAGAFAAGAATGQAEGDLVHPAQAAFVAGSAALDGSAARVREASGAFQAAPAAFSAHATIAGSLSLTAAFAAGPAAFSAGAALVRQAGAVFQAGGASLEAMAARVRQASAEFSAGPAALESGAERVLPAAATFEAGAASWQAPAARVRTAQAAFQAGPAAFAASAEIDGAITATAVFQAASAVMAAALARVLPLSAAFAAGDASFSAVLGSPDSPGTGVRALGQGTLRIAHGSGEFRVSAIGAGLSSVRRPNGRMTITAAQGRQSASWQS